jgi:hypothetical protein
MQLLSAILYACAAVLVTANDDIAGDGDDSVIILESFDNPRHSWEEMNDPVMGGKSTGTFSIEGGVGKFQGEVANIPFLHVPGFIQARTVQNDHTFFPDVSKCTALQIIAKSNQPYEGYRISFGNAHAPGGKFHANGYKANLTPPTDDFGAVTIPFDDFTDFWDDATGDPIHTCKENSLYCPDELTLQDMQHLAIWGEGVGGTVSLEIQSILAVGCSA